MGEQNWYKKLREDLEDNVLRHVHICIGRAWMAEGMGHISKEEGEQLHGLLEKIETAFWETEPSDSG